MLHIVEDIEVGRTVVGIVAGHTGVVAEGTEAVEDMALAVGIAVESLVVLR